jgi:hypothetical protein
MNHQRISFIKSLLRIAAGGILVYVGQIWATPEFTWVGGLLIGAEVLGIVEEIV